MFKYSSVPAWTFNGKPKGGQGSNVPGPGNYEWENSANKTSKQDPSYGFPKNARGNMLNNANPGPGQYDGHSPSKVKGGYIGHKGGFRQGMEVPGPGAYDGNAISYKERNAPKYTMRGRGKAGMGEDHPGPGYYDAQFDKLERRAFSGRIVSKAARDNLAKSYTPGPGNYDPISATYSKKNGKFSKGNRPGMADSQGVGPGQYDVRGLFHDPKKGYSYGRQPRDAGYGNPNPGPGTYDFNASTFGRGPAWKVGKQSRGNVHPNDVPGPGNYENAVGAFNKKGGKINPLARGGDGGPNFPGPGTYDSNYYATRKNDPRWGFGKEQKPLGSSLNPGPGTYEYYDFTRGKMGFALDKQDRGVRVGSLIPGPGTYDADADPKMPKGPGWSFTKDRRTKNDQGNPLGPSDYDIPHSIPDVATYNYPSMEKRKIKL